MSKYDIRSGSIPIQEQVKKAKKFADFSFADDIQWQEVPAEEGWNKYSFTTNLEHEGRQLTMEATDERCHKKDPFIIYADSETVFFIKGNREMLQCSATFKKRQNEDPYSTILTSIVKKRESSTQERELPAGLGIEMYKKLLAFLQARVNENGKPAMHVIMETTFISNEEKKLSRARWEELFLPIIREYRYEPHKGFGWSKLYEPQANTVE